MSIRQALTAMGRTESEQYRWRCLAFVLLQITWALLDKGALDHDNGDEP